MLGRFAAAINGFKALLVRFEFSRGRPSGQKLDVVAFYGTLSDFVTQNQQKKKG